jgi:DNA-binding GntR family transcriptional regulator
MTGAHLYLPGAGTQALDRKSPVPLYLQVVNQLQSLVESGAIPVGTRLENEIDLAERLGVSRPTMRRAMQHLVDRGMLVRRPGVGTQVVQPKVSRAIELSSLHDDLTTGAHRPTTQLLSLVVQPADVSTAAALGLPEGTPVSIFERLRLADAQPLALMRNAVPVSVCPLSRDALENNGLYALLREAGHAPSIARQSIGARSASDTEAAALDEPPGAALLTMTRTAWDSRGIAIEYGQHLYRASRYTFDSTLTAARNG